MDIQRYSKLMDDAKDKKFDLKVDIVGVGILQSALRLLILHPQTQIFGPSFKSSASELRAWCRQQFLNIGFTEEEMKELDPDK